MNSHRKLRTVVIGFGKIGAGYAEDPVMARYFPYATHAQVLAGHPGFSWEAVVDLSDSARGIARSRWGIPIAAGKVADLPKGFVPEMAVIATPPDSRKEIIDQFTGLQGVLVEKPPGMNVTEGQAFIDYCKQRNILVQVNYWRRGDLRFRELAAGRLTELIGKPRAVFGLYGNGLANNGSHMVDFVRMLLGEVKTVQAVGREKQFEAGPIPGDINVAFTMQLDCDLAVMMQPVHFQEYRENGLDIWGERGRLSILQEGLGLYYYPVKENRAMQGEYEVASDKPYFIETTVGDALYHVYSNLADAINRGAQLWSSGDSALQTFKVVEAIRESVNGGGRPVTIGKPA